MNEQELSIEYLSEHEEFMPIVASWLNDEWGFLDPGFTVADAVTDFKTRFKPGGIPCTVIALMNGEIAGTASLISDDMPERPDLTPWLASVYVAPEFRKKGIAGKMIERIINETSAQGIARLHLFTFGDSSFYLKRGWTIMSEGVYHERPVIIMFRDLISIR
jgi:GNAT superfamily N-acetyltransferase